MIRRWIPNLPRVFALSIGFTLFVAGCPGQPGAPTLDPSPGLAVLAAPQGASGPSMVWEQQIVFEAPDAAARDRFGGSVSVQGDVAVVGAAAKASGSTPSAGAAYVFGRTLGIWQAPTKIAAAVPAAADLFATSVSISAGTIAAGAPGRAGGAGAVDVFTGGAPWSLQATLAGSDSAGGDGLGTAVALDTDTVVAGAPAQAAGRGAAYVFVRIGTTWTQQAKLTAADGAAGDAFGSAVALDGDVAIVGAPSNGGHGAAYIFVRSNGAWGPGTKLLASDAASGDGFASAVSITAGLAAIGAPGKALDFGSSNMQGAGEAYVFAGSGSAWTQQANIVASDGAAQDNFGTAVVIAGEELVVGAPGHMNGEGEVYVFAGAAGDWTLVGEPQAQGLVTSCLYGSALALDGATLVVGEPNRLYDGFVGAGQAPVLGTGTGKGLACSSYTDCASDHCVTSAGGKICCDDACNEGCGACSAGGTCTAVAQAAAGAPSCEPYVCSGASIACPTGCSGDAQCAADAYCGADGLCHGSKGVGASCNTAAGADCAVAGCRSCAGPGCFDGVCCNAACASPCEVCRQAIGASADGACTVVRASSPGNPSCAPFACDGVAASCPSACAGDAECAAGTYCASNGRCVPQRSQGTACHAVAGMDCKEDGCRVCVSGFCTDDVCCNEDCRGQCQSCAQAGSVGECTNVSGSPVSPRPACTGGADCGGTCSGVEGANCTYPGASTPCGPATCAGDSLQPASYCDGTGGCATSPLSNCAPYACGATSRACFTRCTSDAQCAAGAACNTALGQCAVTTSSCSDAYDVRAANGQVTSCRGYACVAGRCRATCAQSEECAPGYACTNGACGSVDGAGPGAHSGGGCSCREAAATTRPGHTEVALAFAVGLALRARRRRAPRAVR